MEVLSKQDFAALVGVSPPCVSQWIARKKISGAALVGRGYKARIRVDVARFS
jgi:DNA-binding transcriptional regulator YdaS (Cro superfamily)